MRFNTGKTKYIFRIYYPVENPEGAVDDITDCLAYMGVFDGIKNPYLDT